MVKDTNRAKLIDNFVIEVTEDLVRIDEGIHDAVLINLEKLSNFGMEDSFMRWTFIIRTDHAGVMRDIELQTKTSLKVTSESKALHLKILLLGRNIKEGEQIDSSELIGKSCQVCVEYVPKITKIVGLFD